MFNLMDNALHLPTICSGDQCLDKSLFKIKISLSLIPVAFGPMVLLYCERPPDPGRGQHGAKDTEISTNV